MSLFGLRRHASLFAQGFPSEENKPSLAGATEWLNSEPLTATDLRGHVVLFDHWTFTCINWIRTAPRPPR